MYGRLGSYVCIKCLSTRREGAQARHHRGIVVAPRCHISMALVRSSVRYCCCLKEQKENKALRVLLCMIVCVCVQQVRLNNGVLMPTVGYGCAGLGESAGDTVQWALEAGYRHLDSAQVGAGGAQVGRRWGQEEGRRRGQ